MTGPEITVGLLCFAFAITVQILWSDNSRVKIKSRIDAISYSEKKSQKVNKFNIRQSDVRKMSLLFGWEKLLKTFEIYCYKTNINIPVQLFMSVLFGAMLTGFVVLFVIFSSLALASIAVVGAGLVVSVVLLVYVKRAESKMLKQIPDGLDALVRSIKTGLPIAEGIRTIADINQEPISRLFGDIDDNIRIGRNVDEAFRSVVKKFPMTELNYLAISIGIQKDTGGNMSDILNGLSGIIRERERLSSKIKAMSSEARASASIIGSLPFIMALIIWLIKPDYVSIFWQEEIGHTLAGIGLSSMALGWIIIWKLIKFEV